MTDQARTEQIAAMDDWDWALARVQNMYASALVDATRLGRKLLKGFGYPDEIMSRAQDARALATVLERVRLLLDAVKELREQLAAMTEAHAYEERRATSLREERDKCTHAAKLWQEREAALTQERDRLCEALMPFTPTGGLEWGKYLAWIVEGASSREEGIAAAQRIQRARVVAEERALASGPDSAPQPMKGIDGFIDEFSELGSSPLTPHGRDCVRTILLAFSAHVKRQVVPRESE